MEDDGAAGARTGTIVPRQAGPVRAARRRRLGVGLGQGLRLAVIIIFILGYLPGPRLLPHGRPDRRPRRPRLVADQPLPADQRDAAVPGAGRGARAVASVADGAGPARSRGPTAPSSRSGPRSCTSAARDGTTAQSTVFVAQTVGTGNFDAWAEGPPLPEPRADASVAYVAGSIYVHRRPRRRRRADDHGLRAHPGRRTGALGEWAEAADDLTLPEAAQRGRGGGHDRRPAADRRAQRRRPGRDDLEDRCSTTQGALGAWAEEAAARSRRRPTRRPSSSATTCGCTAAATPTARSARSSAARSARGRPKGCPRTPTRARSIRWDVNDQPRTCRSPRDERGRLGRQRRALPRRRQRRQRARSARSTGRSRTTDGDIPEWKHLTSATCPSRRSKVRRAVDHRPDAVLVGGDGRTAASLASSLRANTAPQSPFFQLGLVGATVPGSRSRARSASSSAT